MVCVCVCVSVCMHCVFQCRFVGFNVQCCADHLLWLPGRIRLGDIHSRSGLLGRKQRSDKKTIITKCLDIDEHNRMYLDDWYL